MLHVLREEGTFTPSSPRFPPTLSPPPHTLQVRLSCLGCKAPLDKPAGEGGAPLCKHCLPK